MSKSKVYFYDKIDNLIGGVDEFLKKIAKESNEKEKIGLKIHFGEKNNDTYINPKFLINLKKFFKQPIFVECNVLYRGNRTNTKDHITQAKNHGFDFIDIEILDKTNDDYLVEINTKNTKKAKLGKNLQNYSQLISLAHFKGHIAIGFGGAIKNIGMGLGSRSGKLDMHAGISPKINIEKCVACGTCAEECPVDAITIEKYAIIDQKTCMGCAHCISVCPENTIKIPWGQRSGIELMEKVVEYALACIKNRKWWHINFLTGITMQCDCVGNKQKPFMKDIGILYSKDPVAIDKASIDMVIKNNNNEDPFQNYTKDSIYILQYAQKLGLGTMDYELVEVK